MKLLLLTNTLPLQSLNFEVNSQTLINYNLDLPVTCVRKLFYFLKNNEKQRETNVRLIRRLPVNGNTPHPQYRIS
jgi:hypothetical protein